jgi:hypothetical protein
MKEIGKKATVSITSIQPGHLMAAVLKKELATLRCYVGEVQEVDEFGVRITLIDWFTGTFTRNDLFIPWSNLECALVATEEHNAQLFVEEAADMQKRINPSEGKAALAEMTR